MYTRCQIIYGKQFEPFGGQNVVYAGDFSQLKPVCKTAVYDTKEPSQYFQLQINSYIELDGKWRFLDDPVWGERMRRFREGYPTLQDIRTINKSCLVSTRRQPPARIQVACHRNSTRDAVNCAIFEEYCHQNSPDDDSIFKKGIIIFMDGLQANDGNKFVPLDSNNAKKHLYTRCSEDNLDPHTMKSFRSDPTLKLYPDCPLMLTENSDVVCGQANGSRLNLKKINVKVGEQPFPLRCISRDGSTCTIRGFFANQIRSLIVEQEDDNIKPLQFEVTTTENKFKAKLKLHGEKLELSMKANCFPLVSNSATTGHKLQGYTAENLLVTDWFYGSNWAYVVLSRVRTMDGLYLMEPLSEDLTKYEMPAAMRAMLQALRDTVFQDPFDGGDLQAMLLEESSDRQIPS